MIQDDREFTAQFFQNLELILAQKRDEFLQALERASVRLACDPLIEQLKRLQEEHGAVMALSSGVEREESPLVYLEAVCEVRERVEALVRTPLPEIPSVSLTPRAEPFLQEHWCGLSVRGLGDGPVPEICGQAPATGRAQRRRLRSSPSAAVLMMIVMLLLTGLCVHHCALHHAEEPLRDIGTLLFWPIHNTIMTLHTLGENIYQHLLSFLNTLV